MSVDCKSVRNDIVKRAVLGALCVRSDTIPFTDLQRCADADARELESALVELKSAGLLDWRGGDVFGAKYAASPAPLPASDERKAGYSYRLGDDRYALDYASPHEPEIDEGEMSFMLPFADGNSRDGVGDVLEVEGIDTSRHRLNPISLFDHGKQVTLPIGLFEHPKTRAYTVEIDPVGRTARGKVFVYQGVGIAGVDSTKEYQHALFCAQLFDLWCKRFIRAGSIGYQVIQATRLQPDYQRGIQAGLHLTRILMLEGSPVVLPANQETVRKMLAMPQCCGKPLSPYLVKSFESYAGEHTAVSVGFADLLPVPRSAPAVEQGCADCGGQFGGIIHKVMGREMCGSCYTKSLGGEVVDAAPAPVQQGEKSMDARWAVGDKFSFKRGKGPAASITSVGSQPRHAGRTDQGEVTVSEPVYRFDNGLILTETALSREVSSGNAVAQKSLGASKSCACKECSEGKECPCAGKDKKKSIDFSSGWPFVLSQSGKKRQFAEAYATARLYGRIGPDYRDYGITVEQADDIKEGVERDLRTDKSAKKPLWKVLEERRSKAVPRDTEVVQVPHGDMSASSVPPPTWKPGAGAQCGKSLKSIRKKYLVPEKFKTLARFEDRKFNSEEAARIYIRANRRHFPEHENWHPVKIDSYIDAWGKRKETWQIEGDVTPSKGNNKSALNTNSGTDGGYRKALSRPTYTRQDVADWIKPAQPPKTGFFIQFPGSPEGGGAWYPTIETARRRAYRWLDEYNEGYDKMMRKADEPRRISVPVATPKIGWWKVTAANGRTGSYEAYSGREAAREASEEWGLPMESMVARRLSIGNEPYTPPGGWKSLTAIRRKYARKQLPSDDVDPKKARRILKDGEVHGEPLTDKQRRMFGAASSKGMDIVTTPQAEGGYAARLKYKPIMMAYGDTKEEAVAALKRAVEAAGGYRTVMNKSWKAQGDYVTFGDVAVGEEFGSGGELYRKISETHAEGVPAKNRRAFPPDYTVRSEKSLKSKGWHTKAKKPRKRDYETMYASSIKIGDTVKFPSGWHKVGDVVRNRGFGDETFTIHAADPNIAPHTVNAYASRKIVPWDERRRIDEEHSKEKERRLNAQLEQSRKEGEEASRIQQERWDESMRQLNDRLAKIREEGEAEVAALGGGSSGGGGGTCKVGQTQANTGCQPKQKGLKGLKGFAGLRHKYRKSKGHMRRLRKGVPGAAVMHVDSKDMADVERDAAGMGVGISRVGPSGDGLEKVRMSGMDDGMEALAKRWGRRVKNLNGWKKAHDSSFAAFCRNATDSQLENILQKEWEGSKRDPDRKRDYEDAVEEAERRGWDVRRGERIG